MGKLDDFFSNLKKSLKKGLEIEKDDQESQYDDYIESKSRFAILEINPEKEQEMLDNIVARIKRMNMETIAILMLETFKPANRLVSQLYGFYAAPFLEFFGIQGYDYAVLLNKKKNITNLINKIKEDENE